MRNGGCGRWFGFGVTQYRRQSAIDGQLGSDAKWDDCRRLLTLPSPHRMGRGWPDLADSWWFAKNFLPHPNPFHLQPAESGASQRVLLIVSGVGGGARAPARAARAETRSIPVQPTFAVVIRPIGARGATRPTSGGANGAGRCASPAFNHKARQSLAGKIV